MYGDKYINWPIFLISFVCGLLYMKMANPHKKKIFIYPSPDNVDKILFKDQAENCFKFHMIETMCPADRSKIKDIPVQI